MFKYTDKEVLKYLLALIGAIIFGVLVFLAIEHFFQKKIKALEQYGKVYEQDAAAIMRVQNDIISIKSLMLEATAATDSAEQRDTLQVLIREKASHIRDTCKGLGTILTVQNGYDSSFDYADVLLKTCKPLNELIQNHTKILGLLNIRDIQIKANDATNLAQLAKEIRAFNAKIPLKIKTIESIAKESLDILKKEHEQFEKWFADQKKEFMSIKYVTFGFGLFVTLFLIWLISSKTIKLYKRLESQLYIDALTGLYSRTALQKTVEQNNGIALIIIDIHAFKNINELYGTGVGNIVLKEVACKLKKHKSQKEFSAYRIASDEFVLLYEDETIDNDTLKEEIKNLLHYLNSFRSLINESVGYIQLEYNIGGAICKECSDNPLGRADMALNHAKENNLSYAIYTERIDRKVELRQNLFWKKAIKKGIQEDAFVPFFQKIVDKEGKAIKYEALMRLRQISEKETLYIAPFKYLEIAKKTKLYLKISSLIIQKSLLTCKEKNTHISMNLSLQDMESESFKKMLKETILEFDIAERVTFEIVESENIIGNKYIKEFIKEFRALGVAFAIDDFGSGFSNFSFILEVKPEFVKIDGSLIKNITEDTSSYELVKSIVAFAKALKITTIAEFVHSEAVFDAVVALGVDEFQGFYFHEPSQTI